MTDFYAVTVIDFDIYHRNYSAGMAQAEKRHTKQANRKNDLSRPQEHDLMIQNSIVVQQLYHSTGQRSFNRNYSINNQLPTARMRRTIVSALLH